MCIRFAQWATGFDQAEGSEKNLMAPHGPRPIARHLHAGAWPTQNTNLEALGAVPAVNIGLPNPQRNGHHGSIPHIRRTLR